MIVNIIPIIFRRELSLFNNINPPNNTNPAILKQMIEESGGTGGVTSWNDLEDKPFGDESTGGDTLTWDGNTDGLICVPHPYYEDYKLYKISDSVPNQTDFTEWSYIIDHGEDGTGNTSGGY